MEQLSKTSCSNLPEQKVQSNAGEPQTSKDQWINVSTSLLLGRVQRSRFAPLLDPCAGFGERWESEAGPGKQPRPSVCFSTVGVHREPLLRLRFAAVVLMFVFLHGDLQLPRKKEETGDFS